MTKLVCAVCGLLLAFALYPARPALAEDTITIGLVGATGPTHWPIHIGLKKGYYDAEGIKLDLIFIQSSGAVLQQLAAGSLDAALSTGLVDPIYAIDKGAPISIVRLEMQLSPYALIGKKNYTKIEELKGKTLMVDGPKGITQDLRRADAGGPQYQTERGRLRVRWRHRGAVLRSAGRRDRRHDPAAAVQLYGRSRGLQ